MATFISEGNIRIRGKRPNIIRFLQEELVPVYELEDGLTEERPIHLENNCGGWTLVLKRDPDTSTSVYFKGSDQYRIVMDDTETEISFSAKTNTRDDQVICLDNYEGPWSPNYDFLREKAMKYKVDIRIFSWDKNAWSSIQTWYRNGDIEESTRKYEDFLWDCPYPEYGEGYY